MQQHSSIEPDISTILVVHPRTPALQLSSLNIAILVNFWVHKKLEVGGSTEDSFLSTENDDMITDGGEITEEDGSSMKKNCTSTKDDDLDTAEQEVDEQSFSMRKKGGWINS